MTTLYGIKQCLPARSTNLLSLPEAAKFLQLGIIYLHLNNADTLSYISPKYFPNFFLNLQSPLEESAVSLFKGQGDGGTGSMFSVLPEERILQPWQFLVCSARPPFSNYFR